MARKKRTAKRAVAARASPRTVTVRSRRRKSSSVGSPMKKIVGGAIYGAARGTVSRFLQPITNRVPLGAYADEAGMLVLSYMAAKGKFGSNFKEIGSAGLYIESAVIGNDLASGALLNSLNVRSTTKTESF